MRARHSNKEKISRDLHVDARSLMFFGGDSQNGQIYVVYYVKRRQTDGCIKDTGCG